MAHKQLTAKSVSQRLKDGSRALTVEQKLELIEMHESHWTAQELADQFEISVGSVAAYVANAHR